LKRGFRFGETAPSMDHLKAIRLAELERCVPLFPSGCRILEIGAGSGWQAGVLQQKGYTVSAIDIPSSRYAGMQVFPVIPYDGHHIPFESASFDVLFSSNVLEHVPHVGELQEEIRRVLAPGGLAVHLLPTASWRFWTHLAHLFCCGGWSGRHGERGNQFTEWYYFHRFWWSRFFRAHGWHIVQYSTNRLFYTGIGVFDNRVSIRSRKTLRWVLGSACHLYVLKQSLPE
jgi:SAM-dependent methyltransferase